MESIIQETTLAVENVKFLRAYHAAPPEVRREVRRLIAENLRKQGDSQEAERILSIKD